MGALEGDNANTHDTERARAEPKQGLAGWQASRSAGQLVGGRLADRQTSGRCRPETRVQTMVQPLGHPDDQRGLVIIICSFGQMVGWMIRWQASWLAGWLVDEDGCTRERVRRAAEVARAQVGAWRRRRRPERARWPPNERLIVRPSPSSVRPRRPIAISGARSRVTQVTHLNARS